MSFDEDQLQLAIALSLTEAESSVRSTGANTETYALSPKSSWSADRSDTKTRRISSQDKSSQDVAFFTDHALWSTKENGRSDAKNDFSDFKNMEEDDLALAIKLQEEEINRRFVNEAKYPDLDQQLRSGHGPYGPATSSSVPTTLSPAPPTIFRASSTDDCPTCNRTLSIFDRTIRALGRIYHADCFRCAGCNQIITSSRFMPHGEPPQPYHTQCGEELFMPRCVLCSEILRGQYCRHPFFADEKYCSSHRGATKSCFSCGRLEPVSRCSGKDPFVDLHDGRLSCMECISTAVLDSSEARPLYLEAIDFLEGELGLTIPPLMREVPVLAVDMPSLNEQRANSISESHTGTSVTRGLTLSTVGHIRHMAPGMLTWNPVNGTIIAYEAPTVYHTEEVREVTAVLVLYGLPKDLTASILAHEAMHVWLRLTKKMPSHLPAKVEEGLCQFISSKYLEALDHQNERLGHESTGYRPPLMRTYSGGIEYARTSNQVASAERKANDANSQLRTYFRCQIETDTSPVYGDGFREAACCCAALGLDVVLQHICECKQLPSV